MLVKGATGKLNGFFVFGFATKEFLPRHAVWYNFVFFPFLNIYIYFITPTRAFGCLYYTRYNYIITYVLIFRLTRHYHFNNMLPYLTMMKTVSTNAPNSWQQNALFRLVSPCKLHYDIWHPMWLYVRIGRLPNRKPSRYNDAALQVIQFDI